MKNKLSKMPRKDSQNDEFDEKSFLRQLSEEEFDILLETCNDK